MKVLSMIDAFEDLPRDKQTLSTLLELNKDLQLEGHLPMNEPVDILEPVYPLYVRRVQVGKHEGTVSFLYYHIGDPNAPAPVLFGTLRNDSPYKAKRRFLKKPTSIYNEEMDW